jgi:tellurite resistance protein TerC
LGGTVTFLGIAMIVLPGPGMLMVPLGLGILAAEFAWARRWLEHLERGSKRIVERLGARSA